MTNNVKFKKKRENSIKRISNWYLAISCIKHSYYTARFKYKNDEIIYCKHTHSYLNDGWVYEPTSIAEYLTLTKRVINTESISALDKEAHKMIPLTQIEK